MYVRWKRQLRSGGLNGGHTSLTAVVVRSERVEGRPRQRIVCYLATIREDRISEGVDLVRFWESVRSHLAAAVPDQETKAHLSAQVAAHVPLPSLDDETRAAKALQQKTKALRQKASSRISRKRSASSQTYGQKRGHYTDDLQWRLGEQARVQQNTARELLDMATLLERPAFGIAGVDEYHAKLAERLRKMVAALAPEGAV
jgi:hypothetical protein